METVDKDTGEIHNRATKGKGSFWISRQAIEILMSNPATAMDVCAYLVLARHTDESGRYSTAGMQAIYRGVGVGHKVAEGAAMRLSQMQAGKARKVGRGMVQALIYSAEAWEQKTSEALPHGPHERARVRWVLNDFDAGPEDRVWISNELIDGIGRFNQPLKRLKRCGDVAARLLLACYEANELEQFGGIKPSGAFAYNYEMSKMKQDIHGYDLWHGVAKNSTVWGAARFLGVKKLPENEDKKQEALAPLWAAINSLDSSGFVYQVVTVMDADAGSNEAQVIYDLDTKSRHGYKPHGEHGLGGDTARISHHLGNPVADSTGRLYGRYAAIVPAGVQPHIVGIYRLRFRVANPKNHGIKGAWARIYNSQKEAQEWLEDIAGREGIELSKVRHENS
jgi:hypothetical protein